MDGSYGLITLETVTLKSFTLWQSIIDYSRAILFAKTPTAVQLYDNVPVVIQPNFLPYPSSVGTFVMQAWKRDTSPIQLFCENKLPNFFSLLLLAAELAG